MKLKTYILAFAALAIAAGAFAKNDNIVDEVAWMVGDQPIYRSDIEEAYQQALYERSSIKGDPYCSIPEQLAIEKLFLHQAELDSVEVSETQVQLAVENRINYLITNLGTREKLEEYFRKPLPEFRDQMTEAMRNQYRIQQVQSSLTRDIKPTPSDVRRYFSALPSDSVPYIPLQVGVQIISINPKIPIQEIEDVKARLRDFADRVNRGESEFSTLAILYSEDGSASRGGEIGFMGKGHLEPEYAAVAFNLNDPKKVSRIVETQYGYHIIQLIEKRGDRVNTRHILLRPRVSDADLTAAIHQLDTIRTQIVDGRYTFEEAAPYISQDKETRNNKGTMVNANSGTTLFEMQDLPQEVAKIVDKMEVGDISQPFIMKDPKRDRDIVAIVKLTTRVQPHQANLSDDYQRIKGMYESAERMRKVNDWLDKKIADTYVRIEEGWDECEFEHQGWKKTN